MEFMLFIGMAIVVLMAYFGISHFYLDKTYRERNIISGEDIVKLIKNEINLASRVQGNYNRFIDVPSTVNNQEYTGQVTGREITINIGGIEYVGLLSTNISTPYSFSSTERIFISKYSDAREFWPVYGPIKENKECRICTTLANCDVAKCGHRIATQESLHPGATKVESQCL